MEIIKYNRGKNTYEFVCETWSTSRAWGHKVTMLKNGIECQVNKVRYYNRTWEQWTYQTAILGAIRKEIEERETNLINDYKQNNNIKKLSKEIKDNIIHADLSIRELTELKDRVAQEN